MQEHGHLNSRAGSEMRWAGGGLEAGWRRDEVGWRHNEAPLGLGDNFSHHTIFCIMLPSYFIRPHLHLQNGKPLV